MLYPEIKYLFYDYELGSFKKKCKIFTFRSDPPNIPESEMKNKYVFFSKIRPKLSVTFLSGKCNENSINFFPILDHFYHFPLISPRMSKIDICSECYFQFCYYLHNIELF